ncbi:MAG: FAM151A/B family protein, partial [Athalassotoga sp.]
AKISIIPVTIPIFVYFMPSSWDNLERILENSNYTLTIWNSKEIPLDQNLRKWIKQKVDPYRVFLDLIDTSGKPILIFD